MLVEDVVTTGSSTVEVLKRLASEDVQIVAVVSVLDRLAGGAVAIGEAAGAPYIALTTIDDVYPERPDR
jgi:orotate phosphoribosyltransferase